jgi:hypothetical protein
MMKKRFALLTTILLLPLLLSAQIELPEIELLGEIQLPESGYGNTHDLMLHNNTAYVLHFNTRTSTPRIVMIDISNPSEPTIVGEYQTEDLNASNEISLLSYKAKNDPSLYASPTIYQIDMEYPFLYIPHEYGFDVVDVSDPTQPIKVNSFLSENPGYPGIATKVVDTRALFSTKDGLIAFLQLNDNNQWVQVASIQNQILRRAWGTHIIWDGGDTAYVRLQDFSRSSSRPSGLLIVDVADFSNPQQKSTLDFPFLVEGTNNVFTKLIDSIPVIFTTAYIRAERDYKIAIIDVSNLDAPVLIEPLHGQPWVTDLVHVGKYVIGAATEDGIAVYEQYLQPPYLSLLGTVFNPAYDDNGFRHLAAQNDIFVGVNREYDRNRELLNVFHMQQSSAVELFDHYK